MARITVEDCIDKVKGPYDLVLIAKERAVQLNAGEKPNIDPENDKNTVIALKEIAENKVSVKELKETAISKLRKHIEQDVEASDSDESEGDDFENIAFLCAIYTAITIFIVIIFQNSYKPILIKK